jgi:para-nitrobenzyl esterase
MNIRLIAATARRSRACLNCTRSPSMSLLVAGLIALLIGTGTLGAQISNAPVIVTTTLGAVKGMAAASVGRFLGIPYAAPPIGPLRWRLPQPPVPWQGTRDSTRFGAMCPQPSGEEDLSSASEDCLFLNVYAPFPLHPGHPVMVWIHGGTNTEGSGSFYDPTPLVETGSVVVVTLNYRLGALGFLAHPALDAESGTSGSYGLADQQMALRWVRDNIAAFGGDPHNVTLFGESSGGMNVLSQLVSPPSAGLFQKAIIESGAFLLDTQGLKASEAQGRDFANTIGCPDQSAACLRSKSVSEVLAKQGNPMDTRVAYALATVDGMILPLSQRAALAAGRFHRVPVLFGNNAQEGRMFVPPSLSAADYPGTLAGYAREAHRPVTGVQRAYPLAGFAAPADGAAAAYGDASFACTDHSIARLLARRVPAYEYEFGDDAAGTAPMGPTHGAELRYLFGVTFMGPVLDGSPTTLPAASQSLALAMRRYWTGFARNSSPGQPNLPVWQEVRSGNIQMLVAPEPRPGSAAAFMDRHKCGYWD